MPTVSARGFGLVEALVALLVIGSTVAAVLPGLGVALRAKAERDADLSAVLMAQSILDAQVPPGAAREGRWEGRVPEGRWIVEVGRGEAGPNDLTLRPVRVTLGPVTLDTLRFGPAGNDGR